MCRNTYPLCVEISHLAFGINKVAINTSLVNAIEFPLESEKVCFSQ